MNRNITILLAVIGVVFCLMNLYSFIVHVSIGQIALALLDLLFAALTGFMAYINIKNLRGS